MARPGRGTKAVTAVDWSSDAVDELAPDDALLTGEAVALDLRPTGFVLAAAGAAIDFLVYIALFIGVIVLVSLLLAQARVEDAVIGIATVLSLVVCLVLIPGVVERLSRGKSLGRLAVGARIVRDDGGAIGTRHAAIRALTGMLEIFGTLGGLALLIGLLSPRSKRLGDLVAGTYSQYERVARVPAAVFGMPRELTSWATVADVARMPDGLSRRISGFLAQAGRLDPARRVAQASALAGEASAYVSPLPAVPPELFLAGVTVVRREREAAALAAAARRVDALTPALRGVPHGFPDRG